MKKSLLHLKVDTQKTENQDNHALQNSDKKELII